MDQHAQPLGYACGDATAKLLRADGHCVGTAVAVTPQHLLTCAHVVNAAQGRDKRAALQDGETVHCELWRDDRWQPATATLRRHSPVAEPLGASRAGEDLALLSLNDLSDLTPAGIEEPWREPAPGAELLAQGFPDGRAEDGQLVFTSRRNHRLHCDPERQRVRVGYSGGPVFDSRRWCVGLVVSTNAEEGDAKVDYLIPVDRALALFADELGPPRREPFFRAARHESAQWDDALADELRRARPHTLAEYRLQLLASEELNAVSPRYVPLQLQLLDQRVSAAANKGERRDLGSLAELYPAQPPHRLVLLKGEPGAGKTIELKRLERTLAADGSPLVPVYLPLAAHGGEPVGHWWEQRWGNLYPHLPAWQIFSREQPLLLLLDGLNELDAASPEQRRERSRAWARWLAQLPPGCAVLCACRVDDYAELQRDFEEVIAAGEPPPHVAVLPLDRERTERFLHQATALDEARRQQVLARMEQQDLWRAYNSPLALTLLEQVVQEGGEVPRGKAALLGAWLLQALRRELPRLQPPVRRCLDDEDRRDCDDGRLPRHSALFRQLARFAYDSQPQHTEGASGDRQLRFARRALRDALRAQWPDGDADELLRLARALGLLVVDRGGELMFRHQQFQEFMAALALAAGDEDLAFLQERAGPPLEQVYAALREQPWLKLPPPERHRWEETTLLAAELSEHPEALLTRVAEHNLPLAGRAAAAARRSGQAPAALVLAPVAERLLARMRDTTLDLRLRMAAGKALGELEALEVLGYRRCHGDGGAYWLPPTARVEAGTYTYGSEGDDQAFPDEHSGSWTNPAAFALGCFNVTNAEWRDFLDAGGYREPRYWCGAASAEYRQHGSNENWVNFWSRIRGHLARGEEHLKQQPDYTNQSEEARREILETIQRHKDDWDSFFAQLRRDASPPREPNFWRDPDYNNPLQPVVGISLFEAFAYCRWLSERSGESFGLPHELQWEAAARGLGARRYPWGEDWDPARCNFRHWDEASNHPHEARVGAALPVGLLHEGATAPDACGARLLEMAGGVWEWTRSACPELDDPARDTRVADGVDADGERRRVVRGGSWHFKARAARPAFRSHLTPDNRNDVTGCRVCRASPLDP